MADLMNFGEEEEDSLFKPKEHKPVKSFEDIFGKTDDNDAGLDDVLSPKIGDDIFETSRASASKSQQKKTTTKKQIDTLFGDEDDELGDDLFSAPKMDNTRGAKKSNTDDFLDFFDSPNTKSVPSKVSQPDDFDALFGTSSSSTTKHESVEDLFGLDPSTQREKSSSLLDDIDDFFDPIPSQSRERSKSCDSLDLLLDAQPVGTVTSCENLLSLVEPDTNQAASSNSFLKHEEPTEVTFCHIICTH